MDEYARFARSVRGRRSWLLLLAAAALALAAAGAWVVLAPPRASRPPDATEAEEPEARKRYGLEGPPGNRDPHMSREAAREAAKNAGILGILSSRRATDSDPMSKLSAAMSAGVAPYNPGRTVGERANSASTASERAERKPSESARQLQPPPLLAARATQPLRALTLEQEPTAAPRNAAEQLLASYGTLHDLRIIDANGYFENTYVPGDPELRALQARLHDYDRASLLPASLHSARFDEASQRIAQPFDAPGQAALAVYVSASERGITSARRMLLQVGLRGTPRYSGRRPTMNIALVLDAREPLDATASANLQALFSAFAAARDPSDKLSLFAAGPEGGLLVAADSFRHGPLTVALQRLRAERSGAGVSLPDALQAALSSLRGDDDPNAPLSSSVAIVIAPRSLGSELAQLEAQVHHSAVADGVPVSAFGLSPRADVAQLSRLALAGQGHQRMLTAAGDAEQAVTRELSAVARLVARAVRLRIRLASGVHLVSVLGSHPLDEAHAERVREAEKAIDQRLRRNLGIVQDRGEDEEGVQIVVPSFYAGDSHVVLLDVVAEAPGQIADVSVRYKDLVQLENGTLRESLWLPNLELARGALQRNVLKNLVAHELARLLRSAGDALASGTDSVRAQHEIDRALALLDSMGAAVPELRGDRELEADRTLAAEYRTLLAQAEQAGQRKFAADSLHLASLLKLQPRLE